MRSFSSPSSPCHEGRPREGASISPALNLLLCISALGLPPQFSPCCSLAGLSEFGFSGQHDNAHRPMPSSCPMSAWLQVSSLQENSCSSSDLSREEKLLWRMGHVAPPCCCPEEGEMVGRGGCRLEKSATGTVVWEKLWEKKLWEEQSQSSEMKEKGMCPGDLRATAGISANEKIGSASPAGRGSVLYRLSSALTHHA